MVTTRAGARRDRGSDVDSTSSESSDDVQEMPSPQSGGKADSPRGGSGGGESSDRHRVSVIAEEGKSASTPQIPEGEKLGRGCRVSRSTISLDEQYLAASLYRTSSQQRGHAAAHRRGTPAHEEAFTINRRYPMREAAKRAMESLHVTLTSANGAAALTNGVEEEESSNSMGAFHFRHHPELVEVIKKKTQRQGRHRRRRRRSSSSSSSADDSSIDEEKAGKSSGSSSTSSSESDSVTDAFLANLDQSKASGASAVTVSPSSSPHASVHDNSTRGGSGGGAATVPRRTTTYGSSTNNVHNRGDDGASLDSSITEASMREESVERAAMHERHAAASSSSDGENGDGTRDFSTDAERRRAQRNARESTTQSVNLNYYMSDAVGVKDAKRVRRRQLDRRYRWLVQQEEEARARGDGSSSIGGGGSGIGAGGADATSANGALGDITPLRIDDGITFDSVGGLPEHIVTLREMVLLPLLYPDLFERLDLKAPRGVLFVGPPGTGKTLMARALANEGSRFASEATTSSSASSSSSAGRASPQRITFFVRKGADMLSKWVGESERQLKLLFEEAKRLQPSIIFFDEIDGLAPTRHTKAEQSQAALVSTLLALLDGLEDRGQVVVIGATNRPDTLDPALRRPGRFDRELVFPLPDAAARRHILSIQLAKKAMPAGTEQRDALLRDLVEITEGYSGADLGALCTEASLHRLRTALPQLYLSSQRLVIPRAVEEARLHVRTEDFYSAAQLMQPSLRRCRSAQQGDALYLDPYVEVLVRGTRDATLAALAPSWSLIDKVLRAGARDCRDMVTAVRTLCAVPIPQPPRPCLLVLREAVVPARTGGGPQQQQQEQQQQQQQRRALQLHHLSLSLLKGLPGLHQLTVHLPQLLWEGVGAASSLWSSCGPPSYPGNVSDCGEMSDYLAGGGHGNGSSFTHMSQVVQSVRQCSPCVVYLSGAEEWLTDLTNLHEDDDNSENEEEEREDVESSATAPTLDALLMEGRRDAEASTGSAPTSLSALRRRQRRVRMFRYYMNMLADTDVIFLLPCATSATSALLLGARTESVHRNHSAPFPDTASLVEESVPSSELFSIASASPSSPMLTVDPPSAVRLTRASTQHQRLHPQFSIVHADIATTPLPCDLRRFVEYVFRIVSMTLLLHRRGIGGDATTTHRVDPHAIYTGEGDLLLLREDHTPPSSRLGHAQLRARCQADRARRCAVWRKVEYRRLQLRHVLMKWVSQYINMGKFKLLASADLDFAPDEPLYKAWRAHTRHHRLGLQDILEKIEDEKYVCLSQYHDDIDQLVRNVRSFFRTRAAQDQRYRLKALDLKETCLLNMYKMSREVIRFCEETRDLVEPSSSDSDAEDGERRERRMEERHSKQARDGHRHKHRRLEQSDSDDDDGGGGVKHAASATALVGKESDPALIAAQSRRAVSFAQRPAQRKRPQQWGRRRRRRAAKPAVPKKAAAATSSAEQHERDDEEAKDEDTAAAAVDVDETPVVGSDLEGSADEKESAMQEKDDEESGEPTHPLEDQASVADADISVEMWACTLLSSLSYTQLYHVFKRVMRGLEVEVRVLNDQAAQRQSFTGEAARMDGGAESTPTSSTRTLDVATVFKQLLLNAVHE